MANILHGNFPTSNSNDDGYFGLAPCTAFGRQNGFNLYNMIGNAWEWVHDDWTSIHTTTTTRNIKNTGEDDYNDDNDDNDYNDDNEFRNMNDINNQLTQEKAEKGGLFLCHKSYCYWYRNAARHHTSADSATNHGGFRCVMDI